MSWQVLTGIKLFDRCIKDWSFNFMTSKRQETRRYLVPMNTVSTQQLFTDCVVVGSGVAGLRAAIEVGQRCEVILLCKGSLSDSNTWNAQGGIASVLSGDDSFESHIEDTLKTGCGINDRQIVEQVVTGSQEGSRTLNELICAGEVDHVLVGRVPVRARVQALERD